LEHLARQSADPRLWEVVVVDNASTDSTAQTALELWKELGEPAPLKVVREDKPGLSHARMRGVAEARYETIGFVDDDNWLQHDWVRLAACTMADNLEIGLLGSGNIEPVFEHPVPEWISGFAPMLACGSALGDTLMTLAPGGAVAGAGMVTRKCVFEGMQQRYGKFLSSDRKGASTSSGGDIEFAYVASILGWKIAKEPALRMQHFIPGARTREAYLAKLIRSIGEAANGLDPLRRVARFSTTSRPSRALLLSYWRLLCGQCLTTIRSAAVAILSLVSGKSPGPRLQFIGDFQRICHLLGFWSGYHSNARAALAFAYRAMQTKTRQS
jgi:hypothetical protein